jgi:hypothetical protein
VNLLALIERFKASGRDPRERRQELLDELHEQFDMWIAARYHNGLLPSARAEADARRSAEGALRLVEHAWANLRMAAEDDGRHRHYHHAVLEARRAIDAWQHAAERTAWVIASADAEYDAYGGHSRWAYERYVAPADRLRIEPDAPMAARLRLEFVHACREEELLGPQR